ncbi:terminase large subunit domain-containing protein [Oceanobacter sp. 4_MG-2023]|uniref:terminase large subunit domain-containing protein n=1 Tax=Oceanobacter sp. 4_MG-2023 TaxID=3062623 RepID=UPI002733C59C|nr:terminase family protein [Oceanobacter sp. 4_MG-2023]MDP2548888.1 terminase family protein [Oceanobacter sp. 4_MG-2023]
MAKRYSDDTKALARTLFIRRVKVPDISRETGVPRRTLYDWIDKDDWDNLVKTDDITEAYDRRILTILNKRETLTTTELNEVEHLQGLKAKHMKLSGQVAAVRLPGDPDPVSVMAHELQGNLTLDAADKAGRPEPDKRKKKPVKNDFRGIDRDHILELAKKKLFKYQWLELEKLLNDPDNEEYRRRFYLKSRQIGWTFYASLEAFVLSLIDGNNKAFLSASKNQSRLFKRYILSFAMEWFGIEIKGGDEITIQTDNGPVTYWFLSTNSSTAQGPSGDVYLDEVFWIRDFEKLNKLAGAIATHKHFRKTYFSTPSTKSHDAYQLWSGADYQDIQEHRPNLPVFEMPTAKQLRAGYTSVDGMYRKIITIHDALAGGADFFDLHQLEIENIPAVFRQLYECEFIDDQNSAFVLDQLLGCAANDDRWHGFNSSAARPYGNRPVAIGYDPSRSGDKAEVVVLGLPSQSGGLFTLLERLSMHNEHWQYQADSIKSLCDKYNVVFLAVDRTGEGSGVFEEVCKFFPRATGIHYSVDVKIQLVLKAQSVIAKKRIRWSADYVDIPMAFMAIRRQQQGNVISFVAARDSKIGHADVAWAIMHALQCEGLTSDTPNDKKTTAVISEAA